MTPQAEDWRLLYHLMPPQGWMNDPNGLCCFGGQYHVFFQYDPTSAEGHGLRTWGHYCSPDLLHWQFLGIAIRPEEAFEVSGVYSGSALTQENLLHLFYTGNVKEKGNYDYIRSGRGANVVHAVSTDGVQVTGKTCVLRNADYPQGFTQHIRDPKVWQQDGAFWMVLGARDGDDRGCVLLYRSTDLTHWSLHDQLRVAEPFGYMWECPDLFQLDNAYWLSVSPQGLPHTPGHFQNIYQSGYFAVKGNWQKNCKLENFREWDMGFDFYAPQTFTDENGRRLLIGWMGLPDSPYQNPTTAQGWQHTLTLPRELSVQDGCILQQPARELQALRRDECTLQSGENVQVRAAELLLENPSGESFYVDLGGLHLQYDASAQRFAMTFRDASGCGRDERSAQVTACRQLRLLVDTSAVEAYLNDGDTVFSTRFYPLEPVHMQAEGRNLQLTLWRLEPLQVDS